MRNAILCIVAALALAVGLSRPGVAASDVSAPFLLSAPGATAPLSFTTQLQCGIVVNGPGTVAATPQYSKDGVTWVPATAIASSITQPGTYIGTNPASQGYTSLRLVVSGFSATQVSGFLECGDSLPSGGGGSGGVTSLVAGVCTSPVPATGNVAVNYTCATPGPQATPSPNATATTTAGTPSVSWSGSWPYTLNVAFPTSGGGGGSVWTTLPAPTASPSGTNWDPGLVGRPSNYYLFGSASPCGGVPPCMIRVRVLVQSPTTTGALYFGILVAPAAASNYAVSVVQMSGSPGSLVAGEEAPGGSTGQAYNTGVAVNVNSVYWLQMNLMVTSSTQAILTSSMDGTIIPVANSGSGANLVVPITDLDLTGSLNFYCLGTANTNCISAAWSGSIQQ